MVNMLSATPQEKDPRMPMNENYGNSLRHAWLTKNIFESRVIADMEDASGWSAGGIGKISFTHERSIDGSTSLRLQTYTRDYEYLKRTGRAFDFNVASAVLKFIEPQDWRQYNRIAMWIYVHPLTSSHSLRLRFKCVDAPSTVTSPVRPLHYLHHMTPGQWNYVIWEIPELERNKVEEFNIDHMLFGHGFEPEVKKTATYDIDRIELQRVDVDKYEGWEVAPGKIAFSHVGYKPEQMKTALASGLTAKEFQLFNSFGEVIITKPIKTLSNNKGEFQLLDFSEIKKPGRYFLRTGNYVSRSFIISDTIWTQPIYKGINFYYCQRCGFEVPGIHSICHKDWQGIHQGEKKLINGGWHDAGDLAQNFRCTAMSVYAMLKLIEQLELRDTYPALKERIMEEMLWGLDWVLKNRFQNGYRVIGSGVGVYTDCIIGTLDDVVTPAKNIPWMNFLAAGVEAFAYQVLRNKNPDLARKCLQYAEEDWQAAAELKSEWENSDMNRIWPTGWVHEPVTYLTASWGIISSLHLYQATGKCIYSERAIEYAGLLLQCQEWKFLDGIPLTGYFYMGPGKELILHYEHEGTEEAPLIALADLCQTFPKHAEWIKWYGALTLHSEYFLKRGSKYTAPYHVLPSSVFKKSEILNAYSRPNSLTGDVSDPQIRQQMLEQLLEGTRFTDEYYLRCFPIWTQRNQHGSTVSHLSITLALAVAGHIRHDLTCEDILTKQLQWIFGVNPFCQSLMYGEGYDYTPLFARSTGIIVGGLPNGIDCMKNDEPYWSATNISCLKENWVAQGCRFLWNMAYLGMPAFVSGKAEGEGVNTISFLEQRTGENISVTVGAGGRFQRLMPAGEYIVKYGPIQRILTIVSGGNYNLSLNPDRHINFSAAVKTPNIGKRIKRIEVSAEGLGIHDIVLHTFNGIVTNPKKTVELETGEKLSFHWDIQIHDPDIPWVVVIIPDNDLTWKKELTGSNEPAPSK